MSTSSNHRFGFSRVLRTMGVAMLTASVALLTHQAAAVMVTLPSARDVIFLSASTHDDVNFGGADLLQTGASLDEPTRSIISFDLSGLPSLAQMQVESMTLRLFHQAFQGASTKITEVYAIADANANWVEGTGGSSGTAQPGTSTWNSKQDGSAAWAGSAGLSTAGSGLSTPGIDYDSTLLATRTFTTAPGTGAEIDFDFITDVAAMTALVNHWVDTANAGLLLFDPNETTLPETFDRIQFHSREATNPLLHPVLLIELGPVPVPEPSSLGLVLLGAAFLARRPRHAGCGRQRTCAVRCG